jgi:hypothetical protein
MTSFTTLALPEQTLAFPVRRLGILLDTLRIALHPGVSG